MQVVDPKQLLARVRSLPAGRQLLATLGDATELHLVGGAVRDILTGTEPVDLDLVVEGDLESLIARLGGGVRTHVRFGTSVVTLGGFTYDIARARRETYARPGALPEVTPASLSEDLRRRDFTVNAAAITLGGPRAGELSAAPQALEDLEAGRLRILHERSFVDDPTRLLRLVRYASRLGFEIEPATRALAEVAVARGALETVSGARVGTELRLLAGEADPIGALRGLRELHLDRAIKPGFGLEDPELVRRALALLPADGRPDLLVLAAAGRGVRASELGELLDALAFEGAARDRIVSTGTRADRLAGALADVHAASEIAYLLEDGGPELGALAGALGPAGKARDWLERLRHVKLEIGGADLIAAGVEQGPAVGRGLRAALGAKLDGRTRGREDELVEALAAAR